MKKILLALCLFTVFFSCAPFPSADIAKTKLEIEGLYYADLPKYLPEDWVLLKELWQKLDEVESAKNKEEAYRLNFYINYKISQIEEKLNKKKERRGRKDFTGEKKLLKKKNKEKKK